MQTDKVLHRDNRTLLLRAFFPLVPRLFPGQRGLNILLRCAHLVGLAGIGGGFLFSLDPSQWIPYWYLTLTTGLGLCLLYLWSSALWLFQLKGLVIILKLFLLWIAMLQPEWRAELCILIVLLSGLIAHAPGRLRGYAIAGLDEKFTRQDR